MTDPLPYGHWGFFLSCSAVSLAFVLRHTRPQGWRDARVAGHFTAFAAAAFVERFGFPLSVYVLSGKLAPPQTAGGDILDALSVLLAAVGVALVVWAGRARRKGEQRQGFTTAGPYACVRHPQLLGLLTVMGGLLLWWPTFVTLAAFPLIAGTFVRTARTEEYDLRQGGGAAYGTYAAAVPALLPEMPRGHGRHRSAAGQFTPA